MTKPLVKFERLLETYLAFAPRGVQSFLAAMPVWLKGKLLLKSLLQKEFLIHAPDMPKSSSRRFCFPSIIESHAASAFFPSPYEKLSCYAWMELASGPPRRHGLETGTS